MRLNKYLLTAIFLLAILVMESVPFLYNDEYSISNIKWGWVVGFPLVYLISRFVTEGRRKS